MFNLTLTNEEVLRRIRYFSSYSNVAGREQRYKIKWTTPKAKAALVRYRNELEVEESVLNHTATKPDRIKTNAFKRLKCAIENTFNNTFNNEDFYTRVDKALKRESEVVRE